MYIMKIYNREIDTLEKLLESMLNSFSEKNNLKIRLNDILIENDSINLMGAVDSENTD